MAWNDYPINYSHCVFDTTGMFARGSAAFAKATGYTVRCDPTTAGNPLTDERQFLPKKFLFAQNDLITFWGFHFEFGPNKYYKVFVYSSIEDDNSPFMYLVNPVESDFSLTSLVAPRTLFDNQSIIDKASFYQTETLRNLMACASKFESSVIAKYFSVADPNSTDGFYTGNLNVLLNLLKANRDKINGDFSLTTTVKLYTLIEELLTLNRGFTGVKGAENLVYLFPSDTQNFRLSYLEFKDRYAPILSADPSIPTPFWGYNNVTENDGIITDFTTSYMDDGSIGYYLYILEEQSKNIYQRSYELLTDYGLVLAKKIWIDPIYNPIVTTPIVDKYIYTTIPLLTNNTSNSTQNVSRGTAINPIVFTWGGDTTNVTITGLPLFGLTAVKDMETKTVTITGTPTDNVIYSIITIGAPVNTLLNGLITVPARTGNATLTISANFNQTVTPDTPIEPIIITWGGDATNVDIIGIPSSGIIYTKDMTAKTVTISGSPSTLVVYSVATVGSAGDVLSVGGYISTMIIPHFQSLTNTSGSPIQNINTGAAITPIVYTWANDTTDVTITGFSGFGVPYNGLTAVKDMNAKTVTISGSPSANVTFEITTTGDYGDPMSCAGAINVIPDPIHIQTLVISTQKDRTVNLGTSIQPIIIVWGGDATNVSTSETVTSGLVYTKNMGTKMITISGTPTVSTIYTITTSGTLGSPVSMIGVINVIVDPILINVLTNTTNNQSQSVVNGTPIDSIVFEWGGITEDVLIFGLSESGLTTVKDMDEKTVTITGIPTALTFYSIVTVGGSDITVTLTGVITVTESLQTLICSTYNKDQVIQTGNNIVPITFVWGGEATNVTVTGLAYGLTYTKYLETKEVIISGIPALDVSYTIITTGSIGTLITISGNIYVTETIYPDNYFNPPTSAIDGQIYSFQRTSNGVLYIDTWRFNGEGWVKQIVAATTSRPTQIPVQEGIKEVDISGGTATIISEYAKKDHNGNVIFDTYQTKNVIALQSITTEPINDEYLSKESGLWYYKEEDKNMYKSYYDPATNDMQWFNMGLPFNGYIYAFYEQTYIAAPNRIGLISLTDLGTINGLLTILGIVSAVDDSSAGTAGVIAGGIYFNITSGVLVSRPYVS